MIGNRIESWIPILYFCPVFVTWKIQIGVYIVWNYLLASPHAAKQKETYVKQFFDPNKLMKHTLFRSPLELDYLFLILKKRYPCKYFHLDQIQKNILDKYLWSTDSFTAIHISKNTNMKKESDTGIRYSYQYYYTTKASSTRTIITLCKIFNLSLELLMIRSDLQWYITILRNAIINTYVAGVYLWV